MAMLQAVKKKGVFLWNLNNFLVVFTLYQHSTVQI